ncbi:MAG: NifU-like protein [Verrucomicrobia bacterium ADurb.Bin345]|nr:MAG: NifU-like protein [Verrucomicrobia bacterium ADurb.Bin345]
MSGAPGEETSHEDPFFGRMNDPTASAAIKGLCGDEMEFYLVIRDGRIEDVRYHTNGCAHTRMCGSAVARRAKGRNISDALAINPREIIDAQECLPEEGKHCAILAVTTLYRAIADYLLAP